MNSCRGCLYSYSSNKCPTLKRWSYNIEERWSSCCNMTNRGDSCDHNSRKLSALKCIMQVNHCNWTKTNPITKNALIEHTVAQYNKYAMQNDAMTYKIPKKQLVTKLFSFHFQAKDSDVHAYAHSWSSNNGDLFFYSTF